LNEIEKLVPNHHCIANQRVRRRLDQWNRLSIGGEKEVEVSLLLEVRGEGGKKLKSRRRRLKKNEDKKSRQKNRHISSIHPSNSILTVPWIISEENETAPILVLHLEPCSARR